MLLINFILGAILFLSYLGIIVFSLILVAPFFVALIVSFIFEDSLKNALINEYAFTYNVIMEFLEG